MASDSFVYRVIFRIVEKEKMVEMCIFATGPGAVQGIGPQVRCGRTGRPNSHPPSGARDQFTKRSHETAHVTQLLHSRCDAWVFTLISAAMTLVPSSFQPGLPANASLWRTMALVLLLAALASALIGVLSNLFEQVDRRSEEKPGRRHESAAARQSQALEPL